MWNIRNLFTKSFPEYIKVTILSKHINAGKKANICECPIALAVLELYPNACIHVYGNFLTINKIRYKLPNQARSFVLDFDIGKDVSPFTFIMRKYND